MTLQARIFCVDRFLESEKDLTFYTGFPNRGVFESVFEFLDPGNEGENIKYWHSESDDFKVNESCGEGSPKQGRPMQLKPKEEFLTLCRLRQGFKEEHLSNLYNTVYLKQL